MCIRDGFKDVYIEPFDEGYTVNGSTITFNIPKSEDWWHMYAYVNGEPLTFRSEYDTSKQFAIRGKSFIPNVPLPSTSGVVEVVLEDYSGNLSEPVYLPYGQEIASGEVDSTMFPDAVLLEAVRTQIGTTVNDLNSFEGTLDLSNLDIQDYTGLNLIQADTINLTGSNLTEIYPVSYTHLNIVVDEAETENGNKVQAANVGYLDVSWENPSVDYEGIEITVTPAKYYSYEARDLSFTTTVGKDVNSARVETQIEMCIRDRL